MCPFPLFMYHTYILLYMFVCYFWPFFFWTPPRKTVGDWVPFLGVLGLLQAVLWCAMMWSESHVQQVSRRFANLSYIVWIVSTLYVIIYIPVNAIKSLKSGLLFYDSVFELWGRKIYFTNYKFWSVCQLNKFLVIFFTS